MIGHPTPAIKTALPTHPVVESNLRTWRDYHPQLIDLSLGRINRLLNDLGNPQLQLPPTIHIAGTNGKGSVTAFCCAILAASGLRCHAFFSPHVLRFNERIVIGGQIISDSALIALMHEIEKVNNGQSITYFEMTTALAMLAYARNPADALVLETGLGGEFDATNIVPHPTVTVHTPIDTDHLHLLGPTLTDIAKTKAGIMKAGTPAISAIQHPQVAEILDSRARELKIPLCLGGRDWSIESGANHFTLRKYKTNDTLRLPNPSLQGAFQPHNAALACLACQTVTQSNITLESISCGITRATIPGRLQRLTTDTWPAGWELWCDGGHNLHAARQISAWAKSKRKPLWLVYGTLSTKSWQENLATFAGIASHVSALPVLPEHDATSRSAVPVAHIKQEAEALGFESSCFSSITAWYQTCLMKIHALPPHSSGMVLIFGSLYLAGRILTCQQPQFNVYDPDHST